MAKVAAATLLMSAAVIGMNGLLAHITIPGPDKLILLFVPAFVGMAVYFVMTLVLGVPEAKMASSFLKKLVKKGK